MYVLRPTSQNTCRKPLGAGPAPSLDAFSARPLERLAPGRPVFWEGDAAEHVFLIEGGMVRVQRILLDGRRAVAGFLGPGDMLGLVFGESYLYTAEAVTELRFRRAPRAAVHVMLEGSGRGPRLLASLRDEIAAAQEQLLVLLHQNAEERLARFLVAMARRFVGEPAAGLVLTLPMSRLDIADHLGLSVETVCRSVTRLRAARIVRLETPTRVVILKPDALLARAGELPHP